ncbi:MAG TPA: clostripain-related cysteine peptidase [Symbiobacteriaceae bacterium]|nr:clostripain-related cysteine peptidase [Symbiobacteriaceae bacterium]
MNRWTVLFYLTGADDLEPYMARALLALEEAGAPPGIDVAVQLFRAPLAPLRSLLPDRQPAGIDGDWSGARRYRLRRRGAGAPADAFASELVADLGPACSPADPRNLLAFVDWAAAQLPAERTLLVISGHGMGFVGAAMDLVSGPRPAIMSIRSLATALRRSDRQPDILLLDACQMNGLEVIAQFALPRPAAGWLVTPASHAPRRGLDYQALLTVLGSVATEPSGQVAARLAAAMEPSAGLQVLAFGLEAERWRKVAAVAGAADGPLYGPMYAEAARSCVYPPAGTRLRLLVTWPDPAYFPEPYHYLYRRLQFARRSGWGRRLLPAASLPQARERLAPLEIPGPILEAWLQITRAGR